MQRSSVGGRKVGASHLRRFSEGAMGHLEVHSLGHSSEVHCWCILAFMRNFNVAFGRGAVLLEVHDHVQE